MLSRKNCKKKIVGTGRFCKAWIRRMWKFLHLVRAIDVSSGRYSLVHYTVTATHQLHSSKSSHAQCSYDLELLERQERNLLPQPPQLLGLCRVNLR